MEHRHAFSLGLIMGGVIAIIAIARASECSATFVIAYVLGIISVFVAWGVALWLRDGDDE